MLRVFIVDANYNKRETFQEVEETSYETETIVRVDEEWKETKEQVSIPVTNLVRKKVANPDYMPKWICVNAASDEEAAQWIAQEAKEIPAEEIEQIFGDKAAQASPLTVKVSADGQQIESFTPLPGYQPTNEELEADARAKRDALLAETDFLLMPDYPINAETLQAVKAYRQALRDLPQQEEFPLDLMWPKKPEL